MAYTVFDQAVPDPTTEDGTEVFDSTRENLLAVRDALIATGFFPGWAGEAQNSDGSTPPTDPDEPDQLVYRKGVERIKLVYTWGTVGGSAGNLVEIIASYSANSGVLYEVLGAVGYPLGKLTNAFDAGGSWLSMAWS